MNQQFITKDTGETVTAPQLPADDRTGSGYDWMETLTGRPWDTLASWSREGWDAGSWPYIIFASATHADASGPLYGYGLYLEGDTETHWFRSQTACHEAITEAVFGFWKLGQSDGPANLPEAAAELPSRYRKPYFGWPHGRATVE